MSALNRLASLQRVKDWTGITTTNDDVLLDRLIDETSRFILSYLQRPTLFQNLFSDMYDGMGGQAQILRHWPVTSVTLLTVDNSSISAATPASNYGYTLEPWDGFPPGRPQNLSLRGYHYCKGYNNINVVYTAGFVISNEPHTVPATSNYTVAVNDPHGSFGLDQSVTYAATGVALASVASAPALGQYSVSNGIYTFAAADSNAAVLISYSYVPYDIGHACVEMVAERYRYKNRIGEISKSLGGQETVSFSQKDMPDYIRLLLQPYRRIVMI